MIFLHTGFSSTVSVESQSPDTVIPEEQNVSAVAGIHQTVADSAASKESERRFETVTDSPSSTESVNRKLLECQDELSVSQNNSIMRNIVSVEDTGVAFSHNEQLKSSDSDASKPDSDCGDLFSVTKYDQVSSDCEEVCSGDMIIGFQKACDLPENDGNRGVQISAEDVEPVECTNPLLVSSEFGQLQVEKSVVDNTDVDSHGCAANMQDVEYQIPALSPSEDECHVLQSAEDVMTEDGNAFKLGVDDDLSASEDVCLSSESLEPSLVVGAPNQPKSIPDSDLTLSKDDVQPCLGDMGLQSTVDVRYYLHCSFPGIDFQSDCSCRRYLR